MLPPPSASRAQTSQSAPTDAYGYHSLVHSGGTTYSCPPLARIQLESVRPPGTWEVHGKAIHKTLFTVTLTYV